mmetsp:Transcript_25875/g.59990  ORF Transcript_25875/g.59990 Transcript_25875/m.59990 type:complete len:244 (+) Transcript_25875:372-1103(+)
MARLLSHVHDVGLPAEGLDLCHLGGDLATAAIWQRDVGAGHAGLAQPRREPLLRPGRGIFLFPGTSLVPLAAGDVAGGWRSRLSNQLRLGRGVRQNCAQAAMVVALLLGLLQQLLVLFVEFRFVHLHDLFCPAPCFLGLLRYLRPPILERELLQALAGAAGVLHRQLPLLLLKLLFLAPLLGIFLLLLFELFLLLLRLFGKVLEADLVLACLFPALDLLLVGCLELSMLLVLLLVEASLHSSA